MHLKISKTGNDKVSTRIKYPKNIFATIVMSLNLYWLYTILQIVRYNHKLQNGSYYIGGRYFVLFTIACAVLSFVLIIIMGAPEDKLLHESKIKKSEIEHKQLPIKHLLTEPFCLIGAKISIVLMLIGIMVKLFFSVDIVTAVLFVVAIIMCISTIFSFFPGLLYTTLDYFKKAHNVSK